MEGKEINVIDNIIQAISILNKTDDYLEKLVGNLSDCDKLNSDFEHIIENYDLEKIDLKKLYVQMQMNYNRRRKIKKDMQINIYYKNNIAKLGISTQREFLIQGLKNLTGKLDTEYKERLLTDEHLSKLLIKEEVNVAKRGRGRPKKEQSGKNDENLNILDEVFVNER